MNSKHFNVSSSGASGKQIKIILPADMPFTINNQGQGTNSNNNLSFGFQFPMSPNSSSMWSSCPTNPRVPSSAIASSVASPDSMSSSQWSTVVNTPSSHPSVPSSRRSSSDSGGIMSQKPATFHGSLNDVSSNVSPVRGQQSSGSVTRICTPHPIAGFVHDHCSYF